MIPMIVFNNCMTEPMLLSTSLSGDTSKVQRARSSAGEMVGLSVPASIITNQTKVEF